MGKISWTLEAVNERLSKSRVTVRQKGDALYLRATLPPKSGEMKPKRRELPVARATEAGFRFAEERAHELEADLYRYRRDKVFDWGKWGGEDSSRETTASVLIDRFEQWYRDRQEIQDRTWKRHWLRYLERLHPNRGVDEAAILKVVLQEANNTRGRKRCVQVMQRFCDYIELPVDLAPYRGNYSHKSTEKLYVPSAAEMLRLVRSIPNIKWRNHLALQATFGLRTHEGHYSRLEGRTCVVSDGKTGSRVAYPLYDAWIDELNLSPDMEMPAFNSATSFESISDAVSTAYGRYSLGIRPRAPRYCYVVDAICIQRLPVPAVASSLGHSPETLLKIYSRYISDATMEQVFNDRP